MSEFMVKHGPNVIHPETPSAVGSRNSLFRDSRDEYSESRLVVDEEVDKILNHIHAKLPPEVASRLEVMGSVKSKLHTYYNQSMQNMSNRYLTTLEDELGKKVRNMIDTEEMRGLNRYAPRSVSYLLDRIAGGDKFNTGEIEKSIVNMYGHLHGHVQREMNDLETRTNSLLRRKIDVGAFVRGENAYAIVKCSFRDDPLKPENVTQVKLALGILDSELISPIYPWATPTLNIVKDIVSKQIQDALDSELDQINASLVDEGKSELTAEEKIFERVKALDNHVSDDLMEGSKRYSTVSKKIFDAVEGLEATIDWNDYDPMRVRENTFKLIESENIRNRGYNTAVNTLTHVLDWSRMGYQHIENYKNSRDCIIREYHETNEDLLPDERYALRLRHLTYHQILVWREAYQAQLSEFIRTVMELWSVVEKIYEEDRNKNRKEDWESLYNRLVTSGEEGGSWIMRPRFGGGDEEEESSTSSEEAPKWNEINFVQPQENGLTAANPKLQNQFSDIRGRFPVMRERLAKVFGDLTTDVRDIVEARITFLENQFNLFGMQINPYHVNPGVLLELDIVSVKRKNTTMMAMANVLNEFLSSVSKGFQDAAFASFSRRRSTQRADLAEGFGSATQLGSDDQAPVVAPHEETME
ncbi:MAG: cytoplasmic filament protein CfpA [Deltaproteobacteria bacterium]|nr:cytoplasmic filament protein CfpA [Deltaproteobacteria bacterium]